MAIYDVNGSALSNAFEKSGGSVSTAYSKDGTMVWTGEIETDYNNPNIAYYKTIATQNCQAMELYNDVLFQFRGHSTSTPNDMVCLYDWTTNASISSDMYIDSGHANAVAFGKTFYTEGDEFPIIYCGDWFDPIVHVNRITRSSSQHLYDIVLDVATVGYHANPCIDFDNEIMYTVGYYKNSTSDSTDNHCIVCKWDLSQMTDNGNGTFTPSLIGTYTRNFIYIMQDLKFSDGYAWITSGGQGNSEYLYGMNPETGAFDYSILMPITTEIEGLVWLKDDTGLFYAFVGFAGGVYYKVTFTQL